MNGQQQQGAGRLSHLTGRVVARRGSARRRTAMRWLIVLLALAGSAQVQAGDVCRVTPAGAAGGDGSSWAQAMSLPAALAAAPCLELWLMAGVYTPSDSGDRDAHFRVRGGVSLYGGFAGDESARDQRDPTQQRSVLSGDIDGDDVVDADGVTLIAADQRGGNSFRVVVFDTASADEALLDGVIVTAGQGDANAGDMNAAGAGLQCLATDAGQHCAPVLRQVVVRGNDAETGAGLLCAALDGGTCTATLEGVSFIGNGARESGAALFALALSEGQVQVTVRNASFVDNRSDGHGGAIMAVCSDADACALQASHVTFTGNQAASGGALAWMADEGAGEFALTRSIVWDNGAAALFGNQLLDLRDSVVQGGCPIYAACQRVLSSDPQLGSLQAMASGWARLPGLGSAAADAVDCVDAPALDQRLIARPQGMACDIGAVEVGQVPLAVAVDGPGVVRAVIVPEPIGPVIADCRDGSGVCQSWYRIEPEAPAVRLLMQPDPGHQIGSVQGCAGTLLGNTYLIDGLVEDCTVAVVFAAPPNTVSGTVTGLVGNGLGLALNGAEVLSLSGNGPFVFETKLATGAAYAVTVLAQPIQPSQDCVVFNGSGTVDGHSPSHVVVHCGPVESHTVGGSLSGLSAGQTVSVQINGDTPLVLAADGPYRFQRLFSTGDGYSVTVLTQPSAQRCSFARDEGIIGTADVVDLDITCEAGGPNLRLSLIDDDDYAMYGRVRDYLVALSNDGNGTANQVALSASFDPAFGIADATWVCLSGTPGATCGSSGSGGFADTASLPPGTSLVWVLSVPVRSDADAADASITVHATGAADASDRNTLVIFRDGVDRPYGH